MMAGNGDGRRVMEEYRVPGSRFDRMMQMVERGASLEEMKNRFEGMDKNVYRVLTAIDAGTVSEGNRCHPLLHTGRTMSKIEARKRRINEMFDEGLTAAEVSRRTGLGRKYCSYLLTLRNA